MADNILLYDSDCGMCTSFRNMIEFLDSYRNLRFMSIDDAEHAGLLDAMPDALRHRSFHLVRSDMHLESGAEALPTLIGLLPAGRLTSKMVTSVPINGRILKLLYSTVARKHEAGLCKLQTAHGTAQTSWKIDARKSDSPNRSTAFDSHR